MEKGSGLRSFSPCGSAICRAIFRGGSQPSGIGGKAASRSGKLRIDRDAGVVVLLPVVGGQGRREIRRRITAGPVERGRGIAHRGEGGPGRARPGVGREAAVAGRMSL